MIAEALLSPHYVGSGDFALKGIESLEVEIAAVPKKEPVFNPETSVETPKWVLELKVNGKPLQKKFILSAKANLRPLVAAFGKDERDWPGHKFTLYVDKWRGKPCLRVRDPK